MRDTLIVQMIKIADQTEQARSAPDVYTRPFPTSACGTAFLTLRKLFQAHR